MSKTNEDDQFLNVSEKDLLERLAQQDPAAMKYIYSKYATYLFRFASNAINDKDGAEDAVQATFLAFFQSVTRRGFNDSELPIIRILRNFLSNALIHSRRTAAPVQPEEIDKPFQFYVSSSDFSVDEFAELLQLLSEVYRSVGGDGLTIKKIESFDFLPVLQS